MMSLQLLLLSAASTALNAGPNTDSKHIHFVPSQYQVMPCNGASQATHYMPHNSQNTVPIMMNETRWSPHSVTECQPVAAAVAAGSRLKAMAALNYCNTCRSLQLYQNLNACISTTCLLACYDGAWPSTCPWHGLQT
jgi:hypothetical protein